MKTKTAPISTKIWAVIPAAGSGSRFSKTELKQYQTIQNKTVLEHSVDAMFQLPLVGCVLAVDSNDQHIHQIQFSHKDKIHFCTGGTERVHSVLNALYYLSNIASPNDWVLVHDAARPCVHKESLFALVEDAQRYGHSVILATPVRDTLKKVSAQNIEHTVPRDGLWQAQTPQMAELGALIEALEQGLANQVTITDEASALEASGTAVRVVMGRSDNIKITYPEDLQFARLVLDAKKMTTVS
ncbi:2-C-methyl-D-erythritol 4-phosphate cytidylyltransferase [Acinetobacter rathckeae]|uniref:2-C-methyl-D-erythritol 4-phosphate cytidylyltransferase n=1 Tax=Acinetobacter rathckeae TaxID=2605272 RepID=UPI0018A24DA0|nr:2-C-methyl-D-erythritol 4-phosphate cytidylyltransferase [Acinetobacter rathckeae]MBF7686975.1 2-C-methyl-D-erythritol 4-phosphate cytidylyltransferase [Acinetobacter rathckeae]MBF7694621.1 2-C-methyl-D-erythritol 4-phosphate cytidylyltransferase [Acinetobacter rathckeae]